MITESPNPESEIVKESIMSFSRISIVEYNSAKDVEICMDRYREVAPIIIGAAEYLCVTMIGPETAHFLAVYPNQQLAEQGLEARVKHTDELKDHIREIIYYEGDVSWQWKPN